MAVMQYHKTLKKGLDQFYTNPTVAEYCVKTLDAIFPLESYDNVVEPSAGTGNIFKFLPQNKIGLDLEPKCEDILTQDFLSWVYPQGHNAVIMNPPYGWCNKTAIQFFNKAAKFAETIAVIVPLSWEKHEVHKQIAPGKILNIEDTIPKGVYFYIVPKCNKDLRSIFEQMYPLLKQTKSTSIPYISVEDIIKAYNKINNPKG